MANSKAKKTAKVQPTTFGSLLAAAAGDQFKGAEYALLTAGQHSVPVAKLATHKAETGEECTLFALRAGANNDVPLANIVTSLQNSELKKDPERGFRALRSQGFPLMDMSMEHYAVINADKEAEREATAHKTLMLLAWLRENKSHPHAMSINNQFDAVVRSFTVDELKATLKSAEKIGEWVVANPPKAKKSRRKAGKVTEIKA